MVELRGREGVKVHPFRAAEGGRSRVEGAGRRPCRYEGEEDGPRLSRLGVWGLLGPAPGRLGAGEPAPSIVSARNLLFVSQLASFGDM